MKFELDWHQKWMEEINRDMGDRAISARSLASNIRYAIWDGQSPDGRKRKSQLGKDARPFEGASDNRIRLVDFIIKLRSSFLMQALGRATTQIRGTESSDWRKAALVRTTLRWIISNQLGRQWRREWKKALSYQLGDAPGCGVLGVYWQDNTLLQTMTVNVEQFVAALQAEMGAAPEDPGSLAAIQDLATNPVRATDRQLLLQSLMGIPTVQAKRAARELAEVGEFTVEIPQPALGGIKVCAYRMYESIFFPHAISDIQQGPVYIREWLTGEELQARVRDQGYAQGFVDELTSGNGAYQGKSSFRSTVSLGQEWKSELLNASQAIGWDYHEARKNYYEVLTVYWNGIENGNVGKFQCTFSGFLKVPAIAPQLLAYKHNKFPFVELTNEVLGERLLDSRGVAELGMTYQQSFKLLADTAEDAVQIGTLPPIKRPKGRQRVQDLLAPLGVIEEMRPGETAWLTPPEYPIVHREHRLEVRRLVAEYFGIPHGEVAQVITQAVNQDAADDFLAAATDVMQMMLALVQQFMTDEQFQRVTGSQDTLPRSSADIQGQWDIMMSFDVGSMDGETYQATMKNLVEILSMMDKSGNVRWDRAMELVVGGMDPNIAEYVLAPSEAAARQVVDDEDSNFAKIGAGVEPPLGDVIQAPQIRLQRLQAIVQANPAAMEKLTEDSRKILENRVKALQFQVQQQQNAQTGRMGTAPVMGGEA